MGLAQRSGGRAARSAMPASSDAARGLPVRTSPRIHFARIWRLSRAAARNGALSFKPGQSHAMASLPLGCGWEAGRFWKATLSWHLSRANDLPLHRANLWPTTITQGCPRATRLTINSPEHPKLLRGCRRRRGDCPARSARTGCPAMLAGAALPGQALARAREAVRPGTAAADPRCRRRPGPAAQPHPAAPAHDALLRQPDTGRDRRRAGDPPDACLPVAAPGPGLPPGAHHWSARKPVAGFEHRYLRLTGLPA